MCCGSLIMLPLILVPRNYWRYLDAAAGSRLLQQRHLQRLSNLPPELYPTRLRATGAGFCFNAGRVLASAAPFVTGWLVTTLGSFNKAASTIALIYILGLLVLPFAPETKGEPAYPNDNSRFNHRTIAEKPVNVTPRIGDGVSRRSTVEFGETIDLQTNKLVLAFASAVERATIPGVIEVVRRTALPPSTSTRCSSMQRP